jgi:hypothetical protein
MHSALNPVQDVEVMLVEELRSLVSVFYTEFSTGVLKSLRPHPMSRKKAAPDERLRIPFRKKLCRNFFQNLLINVEVRMNVLYVVVIFERLDQTDHRMSVVAFQLDEILRHHGHA